jgi:DNA-binding PadR family transcriptional regulator
MSPRRPRSNPLALAILACLREKPMHPYEMAATMRERVKHESIRLNYGSLYGIVENLERGRLIAARETVREGKRPERTVYAITDRGVRELVDWMSELVATPVKEYPQFEAALSLMHALPPDVAGELLAQRVVNLDLILTQKRAALAATEAQGLPRLFVLETEYAIAMLAAERDLTDEIARAVADGTLDGIDEWRSWFGSDSTAFDPEGAHIDDDRDGGAGRSGVRAPWSDAAAARRQARAQVEDAVARTREEADELRAQAKRTKAAAKDVKTAAKAAVPRRSRRRPSDG